MRATHNIVASNNPTPDPWALACPPLEELWACVEGERDHDEVRLLIQHCSYCSKCAERWREVCEQSVDGSKLPPEIRAAGSVASAAPLKPRAADLPSASAATSKPQDRQEGSVRADSRHLDEMALRYQEEKFARPSLVPWAVGAGVVLIVIFLLAAC